MHADQLIPTLLTKIIIEILLKLPVESLLRCKSVCKEWYSLISDQHFIKAHYTLSSTNINYEHHRLICNICQQKYNLISCPLYDVLFDKSANNEILLGNPFQQTRLFRIVGTCNGLMCLLDVDDYTVFILNPSTRTTNILPPSKQVVSALRISYGFEYDETTHDYKVVKVWCCDQTSPYWSTMIYSLKAGSWKEIGRFPRVHPFHDGKFLNGVVHWMTNEGWLGSHLIVSFDLRKETYGEVLQPEYVGKGHKTLTLGVLGESLCVLCDHIESHFDVWVMKVYGMKDSWTKLVSISYPNYIKFHSPLCISNDGKLLLQIGTKLVVYDCNNGSYSETQNLDGFV